MHNKKERVEKKRPPSLMKKTVADILVASHAEEPYIIAFRYAGDNVASHTLGTLVGFFEIEAHDEDAAYIVNFLASVVKKEYFANIRRGPVESFEAALHKVNVALSELVKHGNVTWLGHLNGALAILAGNTLHFSVTGDGSIYLFRDKVFREISAGLSEPENDPHPLKTFVEVASGDLLVGDRAFLLSPSVWTLFTPNDIEKGALRFSSEALIQYLRTALVNELDSAGAILITCEEGPIIPMNEPTTPVQSKERLENVFSEQPFRKPEPVGATLPAPEEESEFVDKKTGHIYVQGELLNQPRENHWQERWAVFSQHVSLLSHRFLQKISRSSRQSKKAVALGSIVLRERFGSGLRSVGRKTRSLMRRSKEAFIEAQAHRKVKRERLHSSTPPVITANESSTINPEYVADFVNKSPTPAPSPLSPSKHDSRVTRGSTKLQAWLSRRDSPTPLPSHTRSDSLPSPKMILATVNVNVRQFSKNILKIGSLVATSTRSTADSMQRIWSRQTLKTKIVALAVPVVIGIILFGRGTSPLWTSQEAVPLPPPENSQVAIPIFPPQGEKEVVLLKSAESLFTAASGDTLITTLFLRDTPFAVTKGVVVNLSTGERTPLPESISKATAMNDLSALFLLTEKGTLLTYTPTNKKFTGNNFPLPSGTRIDALATYLTYLYVLDGKAGKIYRFPRAEGGFGAPLSWLKETLSLESPAMLAVNDMLVLGNTSTLQGFLRGKVITQKFEVPKNSLSINSLFVTSEQNDIYALDSDTKRIVTWNKTGTLLHQYFSEELDGAMELSISRD